MYCCILDKDQASRRKENNARMIAQAVRPLAQPRLSSERCFFSAAFLEGEASELPRDRPGLLELTGPDQPDQNSTEPELLILFW